MAKKNVKAKNQEYAESATSRKPTATFNMSKRTKRLLAMLPFASRQQSVDFKHSMIHAELAEKDARARSSRREKEDVSE